MQGFMNFIREQGVIGIAVGLILGAAVGKLVASLVEDIVNPVIGIFLGFADGLEAATWTIGEASIMWGSFVSTLIDFVIIAAVVYFIVKGLGLDKLDKKTK